jgi:hypothetical protein
MATEGGQERVRDHSVFTRPECRCEGCCAVYDEWAERAEGFQHWLTSLPDYRLSEYLGLERVREREVKSA